MKRQLADTELTRAARARRAAWRAVGVGLFGVGLVGAALPVLPTTIFWIGALLALGKSDPALSERIRSWPGAGAVVSAYVDHGVISRRSKLIALAGMAFSATLLGVFAGGAPRAFGLAGIALGAVYVLSRPEAPSSANQ